MRVVSALVLGFFIVCACQAAGLTDGPYVTRESDDSWRSRWIEKEGSGSVVREKKLARGEWMEVPPVGRAPGFVVQLRDPAANAAQEVRSARGAPLFIVADTHGQFEILVALLRAHGIIDDELKWSFGRGQLVLLGDVFDRGPNQTEILWLIYQLEAEAQRAGGGAHLVLGNHEVMVMTGDLRYLHPKYPDAAALLGERSYSHLFAPGSLLGEWLRKKPAVLKLDELLCLHGGISRAVVERGLTLADINGTVHAALAAQPSDAKSEQLQLMTGSLGPLWYRGYFGNDNGPAATGSDIEASLRHFGVRKILVGHTKVDTVTPLYEGRVIAVQVYPHWDEATGAPVIEAVRIEEGRMLRAKADGSLEPLH